VYIALIYLVVKLSYKLACNSEIYTQVVRGSKAVVEQSSHNGRKFVNACRKFTSRLNFILRHLNSVFMLRGRNFLRKGPLNRCPCLTINVCKF